jgi:hypothetical protein
MAGTRRIRRGDPPRGPICKTIRKNHHVHDVEGFGETNGEIAAKNRIRYRAIRLTREPRELDTFAGIGLLR